MCDLYQTINSIYFIRSNWFLFRFWLCVSFHRVHTHRENVHLGSFRVERETVGIKMYREQNRTKRIVSAAFQRIWACYCGRTPEAVKPLIDADLNTGKEMERR